MHEINPQAPDSKFFSVLSGTRATDSRLGGNCIINTQVLLIQLLSILQKNKIGGYSQK